MSKVEVGWYVVSSLLLNRCSRYFLSLVYHVCRRCSLGYTVFAGIEIDFDISVIIYSFDKKMIDYCLVLLSLSLLREDLSRLLLLHE